VRSGWTAGRGSISIRGSSLPVGALFCVLRGPTRGRPCAPAGIRRQLRSTAQAAGVRRRFAPTNCGTRMRVEMSREGISLLVIQRQLGHAGVRTDRR
jgi:site-specific recombinase XerD